MPLPDGDPIQRAPRVPYGPWAGPGHEIDAAWCLGVLDSVTARSFAAGFALELAQGGGPGAAVGVDRALGQLDQIVREVRDIAFYLAGTDTRILLTGPASGSRPAPGSPR